MGDLAELSGVTERNIRAYRERGLLDPPRRLGRTAVYDEHHLAQLDSINRLLRKGFTSAHIAEFFATVRSGRDLAEYLGVGTPVGATGIEPDGDDGVALLQAGLMRRTGAGLTWVNPAIGAIVGQASDPQPYVRFLLHLIDTIDDDVRRTAAVVAAAAGAEHRELARLVVLDRFSAELS